LRIPYSVLRKDRRDGHVSIALAARKVSVSDGIHISIMLEFVVIGCGYLGRALLPFIQEQPETTIVGVCDVVSAAAQSPWARSWACHCTSFLRIFWLVPGRGPFSS
jgi:hypothetical protein